MQGAVFGIEVMDKCASKTFKSVVIAAACSIHLQAKRRQMYLQKYASMLDFGISNNSVFLGGWCLRRMY